MINGEEKSGVTIMQMDEGLDTGDILLQEEIPLVADETGESLYNKMAKLAMRSALSGKLSDAELVVLDSLKFDEPSTKQAAAIIKALDLVDKRVTLVVDDEAVVEYLSFRNIPKVEVIAVSEANTRNLLDNAALVMTVEVAKTLEEALA